MTFYTKVKPLAGTSYSEIYPKALALYKQISSKTKRRPYIRSAYFKKEKIFLDYFWDHIRTKNPRDRARRLRQYPCALELIKLNRVDPESKKNPNKSSEILHRFLGINGNKEEFFVQIKENKKNGQRYFMSLFPKD